jgi:hypothetical protein
MDDIIGNIGMEYDLGSGDQQPPPEVWNLYRLLDASAKKVHDGTELTVLQGVTRLIEMKSKYNFFELVLQRYREVDYWSHPNEAQHAERLVPVKKIVADLGINFEKIDVCKRNCMLS